MKKNPNILLLVATLWFLCAVIHPNILARFVALGLAVSTSSEYFLRKFFANSTQKMWLLRTRNLSLLAAGIFLVLQIYCLIVD